ncbi:hypothetical protein BJX99DRAFT_9105 [Aspergillus californicus]
MPDNVSETLSARCFFPDTDNVGANSDSWAKNDAPDPRRRRGRPKMDQTGDTTRLDRRTQIRYAQRKYRHKKEAMHRNMESRVAELESCLSRVSDSMLDFYDMAIGSDLHITHPQLFQHLRDTVTSLKRTTGEKGISAREFVQPVVPPHDIPEDEDTTSFGYLVDGFNHEEQTTPQPLEDQPLPMEIAQLDRPMSGSTRQSYSFQERDPSRGLQRYCLEYSYRLFTDPGADPQEFYRVFRLVPCVKYKEKMARYLLCLVRSGSQETLDICALPFYCIGGAGTHYPLVKNGEPVYPDNMRLPRRILTTLGSSYSHDSDDIGSVDRERLLKLAGLDGSWLDCRDVIGYLNEKGVLDKNVSRLIETSGTNYSLPAMALPSGRVSWSLDIDAFFQKLLGNMVILGRSPGFRLRDVEAAFTATLRIDFK